MMRSRIVLAVLSLLLITGAAAFGQKLPGVAVSVTAVRSAAPTPTDEDRGLEDAARELRDAIGKKKGLRIVPAPADADIRVEVTNREQRDAGEGGFGGVKLTPLGDVIIHFHAIAGDGAEIDLKGVGQGYWSRAAKDGADKLLKWIARHEPKK